MAMGSFFCPAARCRSGQGNAGWSVHWRLSRAGPTGASGLLIAGRQRRAKRTLHARSLARSVGGRSRTCAGKTTSSRAALGVGPSRRANARARWPAGAWIPARARADCPGARDRARDPHPRRAHMQKGSPARGVAAGRGPGSARRCRLRTIWDRRPADAVARAAWAPQFGLSKRRAFIMRVQLPLSCTTRLGGVGNIGRGVASCVAASGEPGAGVAASGGGVSPVGPAKDIRPSG